MPESPTKTWLLYGANGYTGRLIAEEAVRRGLRPILAGRNRDALQRLAEPLDCPSRVFALGDTDEIARQLHGTVAVLHCAGPFAATSPPMFEACLRAKVHYLDITGEIDVIEAIARRGDEARQAGIALVPAVGFDVAPSDCLAAMVAARLPTATHLQLAFRASGGTSPGTAKTALATMPRGGRARIDGRIVEVPADWKTLEVPFRSGTRSAVTIPWGDVATAWYSTGIRNIETYAAVSPALERQVRMLRRISPLLCFGSIRRLVERVIERRVAGPTTEELVRSRASLWCRVSDEAGHAVEATLETPGGYPLTALAAVACVEKVLAGAAPIGFSTPSQAFGKDFILSIPGCDLRWGTEG